MARKARLVSSRSISRLRATRIERSVALQDGHHVVVFDLAHADIFLEPGAKDRCQSLVVLTQLLVERAEIAAGPEAFLEVIGRPARLGQDAGAIQDHGPGNDGRRQQHQQHQLHDDAGVQDQIEEREIGRHARDSMGADARRPIADRSEAGMRRGRKVSASTQATFTRPLTADHAIRLAHDAFARNPARRRRAASRLERTVSRSLKQRWRQILDLHAAHGKEDPFALSQIVLFIAQRAQPFGAAPFHEAQIIGVKDHAASVRVLVIDTHRPVEGRPGIVTGCGHAVGQSDGLAQKAESVAETARSDIPLR